jgi:hypothetical protein
MNFDYLFNGIRGIFPYKIRLFFIMIYVGNLSVTLEVILNYLS